jgi:hypothetical protein
LSSVLLVIEVLGLVRRGGGEDLARYLALSTYAFLMRTSVGRSYYDLFT